MTDSDLASLADWTPLAMTVCSLLVVAIEWAALSASGRIRRHREGAVNVASAALTFLPLFFLNKAALVALMFWLYEHRVVDLGRGWAAWVLAYIAYDLTSYLLHRLSHRVRLLWCIHSVHHSAREMKASVSFRGSFSEFLIAPHLTIWLPLLGLHPMMVIVVEGVAMLYGVLLHLNERWTPRGECGWLRRGLITPLTHRLHHANNPVYLDTNYGLTFSVWDHLFGTFQRPVPGEAPAYGLTHDLDSDSLWVSQTDAYRRLWRDMRGAASPQEALLLAVMPPGWSPARCENVEPSM